MAELLISANNANTQQIGEVVDTKPDGHVWGRKEVPPNYVHLTITGATREQVVNYLDRWDIKFQYEILIDNPVKYRIRVSVDPAFISASESGKFQMKADMQEWVTGNYGGSIVSFAFDGMTADFPKPLTSDEHGEVDLNTLKKDFADIFNDSLGHRRFHFSVADVNTALANGGKITLTKEQALARVIDKLGL